MKLDWTVFAQAIWSVVWSGARICTQATPHPIALRKRCCWQCGGRSDGLQHLTICVYYAYTMRMSRKNLYVPDEHEATIERLEKVLESRGQSLSEFFIQSVKNAVPGKGRGQVQERAKMHIPAGVTCGIAVDAGWRHSGAVNALIGPPDNPKAKASGSSLIIAKILDTDDPYGLWIELNSEQKRNPGYPILRFVIPWRFIFGVCVDPSDLPEVTHSGKHYGFPDGGMDVTSIMAEVLVSTRG